MIYATILGLNADHDCWIPVSVWYLATQLQKIVNILLNEISFSPHLSSFSSQFIFILVSSGWWKVAVGCGGLAEGDASEPFCGHTSHGRITLKYIHALMFHTFTAVNLWMSAIIHLQHWIVFVCVVGAADWPKGTPHSGALPGRAEPQQDPVPPRTRFHGPDCLRTEGLL